MTHKEAGYYHALVAAGLLKEAMDPPGGNPAIAKITQGLNKVDASKARGPKAKALNAGKPVSQPKRTYSQKDMSSVGLK